MPAKTIETQEKLESKIIITTGVRTLTGLNLEQAIAENAKRRWAVAATVSFN